MTNVNLYIKIFFSKLEKGGSVSQKALLVVNVQNDYCPGGAIGVRNGDLVIEPLNYVITYFNTNGWPIFFSEDYHPHTTKHFREFGGSWPMHCVRTTWGAQLHPNLHFPLDHIYETTHIISSGEGPEDEGHSPFEGNIYVPSILGTRKWTFPEMLESDFLEVFGEGKVKGKVEEIYIGGLPTDYAIKAACLDGRKLGYKVYLMTDACRPLNQKRGDEALALNDIFRADVAFVHTDEVLRGIHI